MIYLTYDEYTNKGGTLDAATFNRHIDFASSVIEHHTHGRSARLKTIPEEIKTLCRDIVDFADKIRGESYGVTSKSQSAGAVSESVSYASLTTKDIERELKSLIKTYLSRLEDDDGTPLLYCGVDNND